MTDRPTERQHPAAQGLQSLAPLAALGHLFDAQVAAAATVRSVLPALANAAAFCAERLRTGGKVGYAGAGSSGLMALADCLELPGTYGLAPSQTPVLFAGGTNALFHMQGVVEDDPDLAHADLAASGIGAGDALICVSASGATPYTLQVATGAKSRGAALIVIANVAGSPLVTLADIAVVLDTGPEVIAGSTRMGAGTAQKIALNLLSTSMAMQLGHVQDGYMVNLTADNAKLRDRARRIVARLAGVSDDRAAAALLATSGEVKPAILIAAGAADAADAAILLADSQGHLGPALAALGGKN